MARLWSGAVFAAALVMLPACLSADESSSGVSVAAQIQDRYHLSALASYTFTDGGRVTENGYGGLLAIGKPISPELLLEVSGQFSRLSPARLYGLGMNALFFPGGASFYGLGGAAYGKLRSHPGNNSDYAAALINIGAGWLWRPCKLLGNDVLFRTEAVYRLDAHSDRRTGNGIGNGRKAFNDVVFSLGLLIPLGAGPQATVAAPTVTVQVVPVEPAVQSNAQESSTASTESAPADTLPTPAQGD